MEPSSRTRPTSSHLGGSIGATAGEPWDAQQFVHWSEPATLAAQRYRDLGELPIDPASADDLLRWLVANRSMVHVRAFMDADVLAHGDVRVIRHFTFDGSEVDERCMGILQGCPSLTSFIIEKKTRRGSAENDRVIANAVCSHGHLESLVVNAHGLDDASLAAMMKGLRDWKAPHLEVVDVSYQDGSQGAWLDELGRYLKSAPSRLREVHVRASAFPLFGFQNVMPKMQEDLLSSISANEGLKLEALTIELNSPFQTGSGSQVLERTLALADRSGKLATLNLRGMCDALDLVALKQIGSLAHLDASITCFWGGQNARSASSNRGVVALIAESGSLVALAARGRCFHPLKGPTNPSAQALGGAIKATRLEALDLEDCEFSPEQCAEIVEAIHGNRSLIEVVLPAEAFTRDQREVVKAALWRNRPDEQLGQAARVALAVAFDDILPPEVAFRIAGHALQGQRAMGYNVTATRLTALSGSAHAASSGAHARLVHPIEAEPFETADGVAAG